MIAYPGSVHVNKWVVGDINWIGEVPHQFAPSGSFFSQYFSTCTNKNHQWKYKHNRQGIVKAIHPKMLTASNPWNRKNQNEQKTGPQKSIFDIVQFDDT